MNTLRQVARLSAIAVALVLAGGCGREDPARSVARTASSVPLAVPLDAADQRFLAQAAADGMFRSRVAALATDRARDPDVRAFAEMMAAHESAAHAQLRQLAEAHSVPLPRAMPEEHRRLLDQLDGLSSAEFERRFVQLVGVQEQRRCIGQFSKAAAQAQAEDVQDFARDMLGVLKGQLAAARQLPGGLMS
ncbi:DUF4142 domain-containing protein [Piscinibacter sp. XHJ-5]|uniref:DUF4142 domain-containing protein n=1 Tax=Piscinibacter sp. XHJ-5 TaxID=3037797 RepID=UPI0024535575|nr:DUF4142 domain-containing protein [Piscinibacter sp. XHJ-5]